MKQDKTNKFVNIIKKKCIINNTYTAILILAIIAIFIGITVIMQKLKLTPIDFTEDKIFTLTDESKEQVKNIEKETNIYFVGYSEEDSILDLARQYEKANKNIVIETVDATSRPDLAQKYGIEAGSTGIIVESGKQSKVLAPEDLYMYDYTSYESTNIAEEKLTAAIKSVSVEELPKVYFLNENGTFSLNNGMQYLNMYLQNEINEIKVLDILEQGKVPEDCNTLVITSPEADFDDLTTNAIIDYINQGGNILWLNSAMAKKVEFANINKILSIYGINPFEVGVVRESDSNKMVSNQPNIIMPEIQYADVTNKLYGSEGIILFINATKINVVDDSKLNELNVTKTDLIKTSEKAYFRKDFTITNNQAQTEEQQEEILLGGEFEKKVGEKTSKLIIYGENYFISDYPLTQSSQTPMIAYRNNKDLVLNSISYLTNREEDITVRKSTGSITYEPTELEHRIITIIIFGLPVLIIIVGIIVWQIRRRKK